MNSMSSFALAAQAAGSELSGIAGWISDIIDRFGSVGVGFVILIENLFPPIPSEAVLPAAGYLAGTGRLGLASVLVWSTIGSVVGALVLYGVGAVVGVERTARIVGRLPLMSKAEVDRAWTTFDRWDRKAVLFGRMVPGVRSLISLPAGARRMPLPTFVVLTAIGSFAWNLLLIGAGYLLGDRWGETASISHWANILVIASGTAFVSWWLWGVIRRRGTTLKSVVLALAAALLLIGATVGWTQRNYVDAYLNNDIGAPAQTAAAIAPPAESPSVIHLAAAGDAGTGGPEEFLTAAAMDAVDDQLDYDALLLLGDNIYDNGDPVLVNERVLDPFAAVLDDRTQLLAVLGNHDVESNDGTAQLAALGLSRSWYSTVIGDTRIIALDSNRPNDADQIAWLESTLAGAKERWKIVILHHPPYSAGWHGSEPDVQANFVPLFDTYGVDLVLSGHDHDYERSVPIDGVTYVVSGAAAKLRAAGNEDFTAVSWSTYHFLDLVIYPDHIQGQAIDHSGRSIDTFTIAKP